MRSVHSIAVFLVLLFFGGSASAQSREVSATTGSESDYSEDAIQTKLRDLVSPQYRIRERAAASLMDAGTSILPQLKQAFDQRASFDFRRRIKQITMEIYLTEHVAAPRAFLGITHLGRPGRTSDDLRIPIWGTGLLITDVFTGSSADVADVRRGDVIMMLDRTPSIGEFVATNFTEQIGKRRPGENCTVGLLRGGAGYLLREGDSEGFSPAEFAKCKHEKVGHEDDARVLPGTVALRLVEPMRLNAKSSLQAGDLIIALDEELLEASEADGGLQAWSKKRAPTLPTQMTEPLPLPPGVGVRKKPRATAQILRGGEWMTKPVQLGRWPSYLNDWLARSRNLEGPAARAALDGFEEWWRLTFDPDGAFAERADGDPRWRMKLPGTSE